MHEPETPSEIVSDPSAPAAPMVRFRGVRKAFGDLVVLNELDFDVSRAEKLVIIGPSGSGKTTILRVLMTLERPDKGTVEVGDEHLYHVEKNGKLVKAPQSHIRKVRLKIGMVFQHFNLFPHMTARQNVALGPNKVLGLSRQEASDKADEFLVMVGIADKAAQHPAQLSGGQKQRVAIARALAMEPEVMLFDEVTSALDPELVGEVLNVLRDLVHNTRMTMLIVTHEIGFARDIGDRVVMFDEGRVIEEGPPGELLANPKEPRTQVFLRAVIDRA